MEKFKKMLKRLLWVIVIIGILVFSYLYWGSYEKGTMAGKILRVSEKGVLFKTMEGKIDLETFGALKGVSPIAATFDFSIEKDNQDLINQLQEAALSGERVNLHFVKRYITFPWRGDTKVFATSLERSGKTSE